MSSERHEARWGKSAWGDDRWGEVDLPEIDFEAGSDIARLGDVRFGDTRFGDRGRRERTEIEAADQNTARAIRLWRNRGVLLSRDNNLWNLLRTIMEQLDHIDAAAREVREQFWIATTEGLSLNNMGRLVGVRRRTDEEDDLYRHRIRAHLAASTSGTTHDSFTQIAGRILSVNPREIDVQRVSAGTVAVEMAQNILDESPLSEEEVNELLNHMVPAGHRVQLVDSGSFLLKSDGDVSDPDFGLTADDIETGGTLSRDIGR